MKEGNKNRARTLCILLLVIGIVFCVARIRSLETEVRELRKELYDTAANLEERVNSIYANVDDFLTQEASLLSGLDYSFGELDVDAHTIAMELSVVPKVLSEDMQVTVSTDTAHVTLSRDGDSFHGLVPVGLFAEGQLLLTITTPESTQTQYLEEVYFNHLWPEYLPTFYRCDIDGTTSFSKDIYSISGTLSINCRPLRATPNVRFEKFQLITTLNGEEIDREDITSAVLGYSTYPDGVYFRNDFDKQYVAKEGDVLAIRLSATDSLGYVHEYLLHYWKQQGGATAETVNAGEVIYDSNGTLLYGKELP